MSETGTTSAALRGVMKWLVNVFPDCAITLLVSPLNAQEGVRTNYISNGRREDMIVALKEIVARFEGRAHNAPDGKQ
jgi:hypothetical protein